MKTPFIPSLKVVDDRLEIQGDKYEQTPQFKDKRDPKSAERVLKKVYLSSLIIRLLHIHSVEGSIAE
jgi:hypothetical protein